MVCCMENPKVIQMRLWAVSEFWTQLKIEKKCRGFVSLERVQSLP